MSELFFMASESWRSNSSELSSTSAVEKPAEDNKLVLGMVTKRKPGMEFLGKRFILRLNILRKFKILFN